MAHGELRIVDERRARADHHRIAQGAHAVRVVAIGEVADPLRLPVRAGDAAVERLRDVPGDEDSAARARRRGSEQHRRVDARQRQHRGVARRIGRMRNRRHRSRSPSQHREPLHARGNDRVGARSSVGHEHLVGRVRQHVACRPLGTSGHQHDAIGAGAQEVARLQQGRPGRMIEQVTGHAGRWRGRGELRCARTEGQQRRRVAARGVGRRQRRRIV